MKKAAGPMNQTDADDYSLAIQVETRLRSATNLLDMKRYDQARAQLDMARILLNELLKD